MRKFILILLALAVSISFDCKDLMNSNYTCPMKKSDVSSVNKHCHKQKKASSKDCPCPEKKSITINDSGKEMKDTSKVELAFHSPVNISFSFEIASNTHIIILRRNSASYSQLSPTKTIQLLI